MQSFQHISDSELVLFLFFVREIVFGLAGAGEGDLPGGLMDEHN